MARQSKAKRADDLERFIFDAFGFLEWALKNIEDDEKRNSMIVSTICHDIAGLCGRKECFSPRVQGYGNKYAIA
jgi:hypothetical protein